MSKANRTAAAQRERWLRKEEKRRMVHRFKTLQNQMNSLTPSQMTHCTSYRNGYSTCENCGCRIQQTHYQDNVQCVRELGRQLQQMSDMFLNPMNSTNAVATKFDLMAVSGDVLGVKAQVGKLEMDVSAFRSEIQEMEWSPAELADMVKEKLSPAFTDDIQAKVLKATDAVVAHFAKEMATWQKEAMKFLQEQVLWEVQKAAAPVGYTPGKSNGYSISGSQLWSSPSLPTNNMTFTTNYQPSKSVILTNIGAMRLYTNPSGTAYEHDGQCARLQPYKAGSLPAKCDCDLYDFVIAGGHLKGCPAKMPITAFCTCNYDIIKLAGKP